MTTIWKYELKVTDIQYLDIPSGYDVLCVQMQHGKPCLWVEVDTDRPTVEVAVAIKGTGHPYGTSEHFAMMYAGTFQLEDGNFVGHVFVEEG